MLPHPPRPTLFPYTTLFRSTSMPSRRILAGFPATTQPEGTDLVTTEPAPTTQPSPISTPGMMRLLPPMKQLDRKSTRLNSSHSQISYAVFCLKKKKIQKKHN